MRERSSGQGLDRGQFMQRRRGDDGELVPHETEQEAIRDMVAMRAQGRPLRAIAAAVALAGDLALELGEGQQHVQGQPSHAGGRVEGLGHRDEGDAVRLRRTCMQSAKSDPINFPPPLCLSCPPTMRRKPNAPHRSASSSWMSTATPRCCGCCGLSARQAMKHHGDQSELYTRRMEDPAAEPTDRRDREGLGISWGVPFFSLRSRALHSKNVIFTSCDRLTSIDRPPFNPFFASRRSSASLNEM